MVNSIQRTLNDSLDWHLQIYARIGPRAATSPPFIRPGLMLTVSVNLVKKTGIQTKPGWPSASSPKPIGGSFAWDNANMEFWNQLRIGDLRAAVTEGDPGTLRNLPKETTGTVEEFRKFFMATPVIDVLKLVVPYKADAVFSILNGIELLAHFN